MAVAVTVAAGVTAEEPVVSKVLRIRSAFASLLLPFIFFCDAALMAWRFRPLNSTWYGATDQSEFAAVAVARDICAPFLLFWAFVFCFVFCLSRYFRMSQAVCAVAVSIFAVLNTLILTPALFGAVVFHVGLAQDILALVMAQGPTLVILYLFACVLFLLFSVRNKFSGKALVKRLFVAAVLFLLFIFLAVPPIYTADIFLAKIPALRKPTVLFVGIDALKADSYRAEPWLAEKNHPYLEYEKKYLKSRNVYTPIAKTQLTYVSILSGKSPEEAGVDTIFASALQSFHAVLAESLVFKLAEERGLQVTYLGSDQEYAFFPEVASYFSSHGTPAGVQNILGPAVLRSPFFFGLLNNWLGLYLAPEVIGNSSYSDTYWPVFFVKKVLDNLRDIRGNHETVLFSHLVKAHWPGALQWPFYLQERKYLPGYDQLTSKANLVPIRNSADLLRNRIVYAQLKRQVLDEFLDPLFARLLSVKESKLSVYVLSDHGEEFFSDGPLPLSKTPRHGTSVLFEGATNALYFRAPLGFSADDFSVQDLLPFVFNTNFESRGPRLVEMASDRWVHRTHSYQIFGGRCPACAIRFAGRVPIVNMQGEELIRVTRERKWRIGNRDVLLIPNDFGYFLSATDAKILPHLAPRLTQLSLQNYVPQPVAVRSWAGYLYLEDKESLNRLDQKVDLITTEQFQYILNVKALLYRNLDLRSYLKGLKKISTWPADYIEPILTSLFVEVCPLQDEVSLVVDKKWFETMQASCRDWAVKRPYYGDAMAYLQSPAGEVLKAEIFSLMDKDPANIIFAVQRFEQKWFSDMPIPFLGGPIHAFVLWQLNQRGAAVAADQYARDLVKNYPLSWPLLRILLINERGRKLFANSKFREKIHSSSLTREQLLLLY